MENTKAKELIDMYVKSIRDRLSLNNFGKSTTNLNDLEWTTKELAKAEQNFKMNNATSIALVLIMIVVVLLNQFKVIQFVDNNVLIILILLPTGLYMQVQRTKIKIEQLKTVLFLHKIKNNL